MLIIVYLLKKRNNVFLRFVNYVKNVIVFTYFCIFPITFSHVLYDILTSSF